MTQAINFSAERISSFGWKYYNSIRKKAMEQEFSWPGLIINLSIAFFIVIASAQALSFAYQSIISSRLEQKIQGERIYRLENIEHVNIQAFDQSKYLKLKISEIIT